MAQQEKLDWNAVNTDALKGDMAAKWKAYEKAHEAEIKAMEAFRKVALPKAQEMAEAGTEPVLIYKRGKLLLAFKTVKAGSTGNSTSQDAITL